MRNRIIRMLAVSMVLLVLFAASAFADPKAMDAELAYNEAFPCEAIIFTKTARIESAGGRTIVKLKQGDLVSIVGMHDKYFFALLDDGTSAFLKCDSVAVEFNCEIYGTANKDIKFYTQPEAKSKYEIGEMEKGEPLPIRSRIGKWYVCDLEGEPIYTLAKNVTTY